MVWHWASIRPSIDILVIPVCVLKIHVMMCMYCNCVIRGYIYFQNIYNVNGLAFRQTPYIKLCSKYKQCALNLLLLKIYMQILQGVLIINTTFDSFHTCKDTHDLAGLALGSESNRQIHFLFTLCIVGHICIIFQ